MERRGILKLAIFFLSLVIGRASFAIPHLPDDVAIREALAARLVAMQSLQVFYNSATVYSPDDSVPGTTALGNLAFSTMSGTKNSSEHFFFLSGRALWRSEKSPRDIAVEKKGGRVSIDTAESYSFSDHTIETYTERTGQSTGRIENALRPPDFRTVDFGLGLRNVLTKECFTAQSLGAMEMSRDNDGKVVLRQTNARQQVHEWIFEPNLGFAFIAFRRHDNRAPHSVLTEITATDFKKVDGLALPFTITEREIHTDGHDLMRWQATVQSYKINAKENVPSLYHLPWPKDALVIDTRTGNEFHIRENAAILSSQVLSEAINSGAGSPRGPIELRRWAGQTRTPVVAASRHIFGWPVYITGMTVILIAVLVIRYVRTKRQNQ